MHASVWAPSSLRHPGKADAHVGNGLPVRGTQPSVTLIWKCSLLRMHGCISECVQQHPEVASQYLTVLRSKVYLATPCMHLLHW